MYIENLGFVGLFQVFAKLQIVNILFDTIY